MTFIVAAMSKISKASLLALCLGSSFDKVAHAQRLDCDPCIDRTSYSIKAITHGISTEPFWQEMKGTMEQAANDLRVNFSMDLYESFDSATMAADILSLASNPDSIDALIVTIPSLDVQDAVEQILDTVPVFGLNAGLDISGSLLGFVGSDDALAGKKVGKRIASLVEEGTSDSEELPKGLFINHAPSIELVTVRAENIQMETENLVEWTTISSDDIVNAGGNLTAALANCSYDFIQIFGLVSLDPLLPALEANGCNQDEYILGAFDVNADVYEMISNEIIDFSVSQQTYVQAGLPLVMASIYATTGMALTVPSEALYLSGPKIVSANNLPSKNIRACEGEGFPVCSNQDVSSRNLEVETCSCANRPDIKISAITHAQDGDIFWDTVFSAFDTAATDMSIDLNAIRFDAGLTSEEVIEAQVAAIEAACNSDIDGLIVSFSAEAVVDATSKCPERKIPVMVINAGPSLAKEANFQYVGQTDYRGGLLAGRRLVEAGVQSGWCVSHANVSVLWDRCNGFEQAFTNAGVEYLGVIDVDASNETQYMEVIESTLGPGDWTGIGALAAGGPQIEPMISVLDDHPELVAGAFDVSAELYQALEDGTLIFGIDQNAYLQGYFPVVLLTWFAYTGQDIVNENIATGPRFVTKAPSMDVQICTDTNFETCAPTAETESEDLSEGSSAGYIPAMVGSAGILGITLLGMASVLDSFFF